MISEIQTETDVDNSEVSLMNVDRTGELALKIDFRRQKNREIRAIHKSFSKFKLNETETAY